MLEYTQFLLPYNFLRCYTVQLLAILLEILDDFLTGAADDPLSKCLGRFRVWRFRTNQKMRRVQKRVIGVVSGGFEDGGLTGQVGGKREERASIGECVLVEQDGRRQGLERKGDVLMVPRPSTLSAGILPPCALKTVLEQTFLFREL